MAKRKSDDDAPLPHKRAKLHHQVIHDGQTTDASILHDGALHSPPLSLASPGRSDKRKRTPDSQSDTFEESETKRTRRSPSPSDSPDLGSEPWPSIEYNPRKEEPCPLRQFINEMHEQDMLLHEEYDSDTAADHHNPLPSPEPSDGDASQSDGWDFPTIDSIQARHATPPKTSKLHSRQRPRERDAIPPQRKRRQPPKKGKDGEKKQHQSQNKALSPAVETFLRSKRSSRRDPNCKLWHLSDNGTACAVSIVR